MDTLYALPREEAKQLFACRTPDSLRAFVATLAENASVAKVELSDSGVALHQALTGGDEASAGEYPLNHVVLGGRPLIGEADCTVILKRPDMAGHIVTALANVKLPSPELEPLLKSVAAFYQAAAAGGCAVVLVRATM